ncbi:MAG: hypothetical protein JNM68_04590 [Dinghuibacter sp.]|nr:hypothetical protein [Dinghuibacter sp.]
MMKWRVLGVFCLLAGSFSVQAQNPEYTGVWQGKFYDNSSFIVNNDPYKFEVQIEQNGKALEGVTYSYLNTSFYGKAAHNGYIKTDGKKLVFVETRLLELRSQSGLACLMTCNVRYYKIGNEEFLEGTYTAVDKDNGTPCPGGYVKLKKVPRSDFRIEPRVKKRLDDIKKLEEAKNKPKPKPKPKPIPPPVIKPPVVKNDTPQTPVVKVIPPVKKDTPVNVVIAPPVVKKDTPVYTPPVVVPPVLKERSNQVVEEVIIADTNEVVVNLYDYGEVDGDIVTIFLDNREIISKQMLRVTPISIPIKVNEEHPEHTLTLVAENLGSIPPNTALMVTYVNDQRYEVKIESTEQKNATVKFIYKPKAKGKK